MRKTETLASVAMVTIVVLFLQRRLPAETFFTGDSGVKLLATQNVLRHPWHPLEIPLPQLGGRPLPYLDPFFVVHGNHSHALTPEAFPILSAPLLALFGSRGLYVLPTVGAILALLGWAWIALLLDARRRPLAVILALTLASPLLFYALEFWEHAPAFGAGTVALGCLLASLQPNSRRPRGLRVLAGVLYGLSFLLRPEAVLFALVSVASVAIMRFEIRRVAPLAELFAGFILPLTPLVMYNTVHFGTPTNPHLARHTGMLVGAGWFATRATIVRVWILQNSRTNFVAAAPLVLVAGLLIFRRVRFEGVAFLVLISAMFSVAAILTSPNDGGAQWGPRYLLFAYGPLAVLVADAIVDTRVHGRTVGVVLTIAVLCVGVWSQRSAYKSLSVAKTSYGRVLHFVEAAAPPSGYVVTDLWWLDQVAAAAAVNRTFLYARTPSEFGDIASAVRAARGVVFVSSASEGPQPPVLTSIPGCRLVEGRHLAIRDLTASSVVCASE